MNGHVGNVPVGVFERSRFQEPGSKMQAWLAPKYLMWLWQGFGVTVGLALTVALAATVSGFVLAIARHARYGWLRRATATYVLVFPKTPLLVQLFFWYFGAGTLMPDALMQWLNTPHGVHLGAYALRWPSFEFVAGWLGLTCYTAAFIAEEFQAGLRGVPGGQHAAAAALRLTPLPAFRHVAFPPAVPPSPPPPLRPYINLLKKSILT